jgi:uncharacterized protein YndB with AHSA1/START domain
VETSVMKALMPNTTVNHSTFVLERSYLKPPARVFAAFADPAKRRRWFAEGDGHDLDHYELDFRVGGFERHRYRMSQGTPVAGLELANECRFEVIAPDELVVMAQTMDLGGRRISASLVTFELRANDAGTNLVLTHQAAFFEGADGPEMRKHGWVALLDKLDAELAR